MKLCITLIFCGLFASLHGQTNRSDAIYSEYENLIIKRLDQYFHDGQFHECISMLRIRQGMHPNDAQIAGDIVWMYGNIGQHDQAFVESTRFLNRNPKDWAARRTDAQLYFGRKIFWRTIDLLEPIIMQTNDIGIFTMLMRSYEDIGLIGEALRVAQQRHKVFPNDPVAERHVRRLSERIKG